MLKMLTGEANVWENMLDIILKRSLILMVLYKKVKYYFTSMRNLTLLIMPCDDAQTKKVTEMDNIRNKLGLCCVKLRESSDLSCFD